MNDASGERPLKMWNAQFVLLLIIEILLQTGIFILQPNLSNYLIMMGASFSVAGVIVGLNYCTALLLRFIGGYICDLLDKKTLLIGACCLFVIASLGIVLAQNEKTVAFFRIVQGLAYVLKSSVVVSMASMVVPKDCIGAGVGTMGLGFTIACSVGPALGDFLGGVFGYRVSFSLSVILFLCALALSIRIKAPIASHGSWRKIDGDKKREIIRQCKRINPSEMIYYPSIPLAITVFFAFISQSMMLSIALSFADAVGVAGASIYYVTYACVAMFAKPASGKVLDKRGALYVLAPMTVVVCAAMLLLAFNFSALTLGISGALMGLGQGAIWSCLQAEAVRNVNPEMAGRSANTFYFGSDLTQCLCPFALATVFTYFGISMCFVFAAICSVIALLLFVMMYGKS